MSPAATGTAGPVGAPAPVHIARLARRRRREALLGYLMVLPAVLVFAAFVFYPFARNFYLALYRNPPFPGLPTTFVGLHQAADVLGSHDFLSSLWTTVLFALLTVPAGLAGGLALAVAAHQRLRGIGVYRTIFSSTVATSVAVTAVIFGTLMNPVVGLLPWLGVDPKPPVLENPTWALFGVAALTVWQGLGLAFIVMSAGLQAVPDDLMEAAAVDGAGGWQRFRRVTLPLLSPTIFFAVVVATIVAFQSFGQIDLLTADRSVFVHTNVLTYFIYRTLRFQGDPGRAAVLSVALFAVTLLLTLLELRFLERRVSYAR